MEENLKRGDNSQEISFGMEAFCWDETEVEHPEVTFHQILYFQSSALQTCEYCKHRVSS